MPTMYVFYHIQHLFKCNWSPKFLKTHNFYGEKRIKKKTALLLQHLPNLDVKINFLEPLGNGS